MPFAGGSREEMESMAKRNYTKAAMSGVLCYVDVVALWFGS